MQQLNHRRAGFRANAMSVWNVPEDRAEEIGRKIAEFRAVATVSKTKIIHLGNIIYLPMVTPES